MRVRVRVRVCMCACACIQLGVTLFCCVGCRLDGLLTPRCNTANTFHSPPPGAGGLGHGDTETRELPTELAFFKDNDIKIADIG